MAYPKIQPIFRDIHFGAYTHSGTHLVKGDPISGSGEDHGEVFQRFGKDAQIMYPPVWSTVAGWEIPELNGGFQ